MVAPAVSAPVVRDGVVLITQAEVAAGNITPGDTAGFPITISRSGTYRLAGNLQVAVGPNGFVVQAPHVTLDFAGFHLDGVGKAGSGVVGKQPGLTVRGGTISGFKRAGISSAGAMLMVEKMRIFNNQGDGVNDAGGDALIVGSLLVANAYGVQCAKVCHVQDNVVSGNRSGGIGIAVNLDPFERVGASIMGNTISANGGYGARGNGFSVGGNNFANNISGNFTGLYNAIDSNGCSGPC